MFSMICLELFFPKQLLSWMGFSILARNGLCSLMICWLLLVPPGVPVLVSLLLSSLFPQERGSVPSWFAGSSWFRLGFRCLSPFFSLLWFRCLSPFFSLLSFLRKGVLFHHDLLVPPGSGSGSGACLPSYLFFLFSGKEFCSIMICWFLLVPAGFRFLFPFFSLLSFLRKRVLFLLLRAGVPVLVSLLLPFFFASYLYGWSNEGGKQKTGVCQTVPWILNCTWPWWKHALGSMLV